MTVYVVPSVPYELKSEYALSSIHCCVVPIKVPGRFSKIVLELNGILEFPVPAQLNYNPVALIFLVSWTFHEDEHEEESGVPEGHPYP